MHHNKHLFWSWLAQPRHGWELLAFIAGAVVLGMAVLAFLTTVPQRYRKFLVAGITFLAGLYLSLEFFIPPDPSTQENFLTKGLPTLSSIEMVVGSFALLLGVWNLVHMHGKIVLKLGKGWYNSAAFFISLISIMILGFLRDARVFGTAEMFNVLFSGFMLSLQATTFSLIAFYIVSAAYRAFRIRSAEAALMMIAATIVMLALVPVGAIITSWIPETGFWSAFRIERIGYWILTSPNMSVQRAIAFGIAVGALATGLRIWLSLERGSFFDRQL